MNATNTLTEMAFALRDLCVEKKTPVSIYALARTASKAWAYNASSPFEKRATTSDIREILEYELKNAGLLVVRDGEVYTLISTDNVLECHFDDAQEKLVTVDHSQAILLAGSEIDIAHMLVKPEPKKPAHRKAPSSPEPVVEKEEEPVVVIPSKEEEAQTKLDALAPEDRAILDELISDEEDLEPVQSKKKEEGSAITNVRQATSSFLHICNHVHTKYRASENRSFSRIFPNKTYEEVITEWWAALPGYLKTQMHVAFKGNIAKDYKFLSLTLDRHNIDLESLLN